MHLNFSFFSSLSFRLSNEIHLSYTVAYQGYRILCVFTVDHGLHHTRVSFCFGGGLGGFLCVFFWFGFVLSFFGGDGFVHLGFLFICLEGLVFWGFVCLFLFYCNTFSLFAFSRGTDHILLVGCGSL